MLAMPELWDLPRRSADKAHIWPKRKKCDESSKLGFGDLKNALTLDIKTQDLKVCSVFSLSLVSISSLSFPSFRNNNVYPVTLYPESM